MGIAASAVDVAAEHPEVPAIPDAVATVSDLRVTFRRNGHDVHALRGVSLTIAPGEILGLVGESGSGKSVLGFTMLGLLPKAAKVDGTVRVTGSDMVDGDPKALRKVRRLDLGAVFQDPMTSLNPTMRIGRQVAEAAGSEDDALRLLTAVGIPDPKRRMRAYPHELSGGLRQRVMIAIAIAGDPELIIADEPTTALDVTVQAQVLRLLQRLRDEIGCSIVLITHDLGVAAQISDRIAVLYAGRIAEIGPAAEVLGRPAHPYTHGLLRSRLTLETARDRKLAALAGSVPSPVTPLPGCAFVPRCALSTDDCTKAPPAPIPVEPDRVSACIRPLDVVVEGLGAATTNTAQPYPEVERAAHPPSVVLQDVTKTFAVTRRWLDRSNDGGGKLQALRGVTLRVGHGESVALVGESGSGKSTLLRVIAGLEKATSGTVEARRRRTSADGVPGRRRLAHPVDVGRRADRRTPTQHVDVTQAAPGCRRRGARARRAARRRREVPRQPTLRRTASAGVAGARHRGATVGPAVRRTHQRARRVAGGIGAEPDRRPAPQSRHVGGVRDA